MEATRVDWTDDRLDDLSSRMDAGFQRVDDDVRGLRDDMNAGIRDLRADMNAGFKRVDDDIRELRSEMSVRFERVDAKFDVLNRTLLQIGGGMIAAFGAALIGLIATQL